MQLGMIGLGKMGANMVGRLRDAGHEVIGYDVNPGARDVDTLEDLIAALDAPRAVWLMVPAGEPTQQTIAAVGELLSAGDLLVDGGNSRFTDDQVHAAMLAERGIGFVDCGVSGGVWGRENGYGLMAGGSAENVARLQPIFDALRPPVIAEEPGAGYAHAGDVGAGHFAKMVHNGIEYGLMQAYAEGYELLAAADLVTDVPAVLAAWTQGTVIRSWLLDLLVRALETDPELDDIRGYVQDSGEGRWTVEEAIKHRVPMPVISAALFARFASRQDDSPAMQAVAALRNQFGGHATVGRDEDVEAPGSPEPPSRRTADRVAGAAPDRAAPDGAAPDRAAPDRAAPDRAAPDRAAPEKAGAESAAGGSADGSGDPS